MPISLIACITQFKNKLAIGRTNNLLFRIKEDLTYFQQVTTGNVKTNIVLMGRKTWFSLPAHKRPLPNRINIVLTNNQQLHQVSPLPKGGKLYKDTYYSSLKQFLEFYKKQTPNVFIIGGGEIYNFFINSKEYQPHKIYLTEVQNFKFDPGFEPDVFMDKFDESYKLVSVSEKYTDLSTKANFRFLVYHRYPQFKSDENNYLQYCKFILQNGSERSDRTGVGTISCFGQQLRFDISESIPLLTTKRVPWKHAIEELLWFLRGDTDAKVLQRKNVKIWDGNSSRDFLNARGLHHYEEGVLGPLYGWQMRFFGAKYTQAFADTSKIDATKVGGFDQIEYVLKELKTNPYSRRIMMSYWNPPDFEKMALLPCHFSAQFYVEDKNGEKLLSCHFTQRSQDVFLGAPFNIFSYSVLTYILAVKTNMKPKELIMSVGDAHIYSNHVLQVQEQLSRNIKPFPKLIVHQSVKTKNWNEITIDDFDIVGYMPDNPIKASMAV